MIKYLVLIGFCFGIYGVAGGANASDIDMSDSIVSVDIYPTAGRTVLVSVQKKILVDYEIGKIAVNQQDGQCFWYSLNSPGPGEDSGEFFARRRALLGEIQRSKTASHVGHNDRDEVVILEFGGLLNRMRPVAFTPSIYLGMEFVPHHEKLTVARNNPQHSELVEIAAYNEQFYLSEPLLRQVDPLGLFSLVGGVVTVREWLETRKSERYRYILEEYEFPLDHCREKTDGQ